MFMYTVKQGDTLYSIARKYGTTVDEIKRLNYFKDNNLTVGSVIRIPETYTKEEDMVPPNYTNYTVKKGDTLYSIAKNNGISVDTLKQDNALTDNNLTVGSVLKIRIPGGSNMVVEECFGEDYTPPSDNTINYTVKKGDSLYNIAKSYNTSVDTIKRLNNLTSNTLSIGQVLKIPAGSSNGSSGTTYTVKSGESLYSIAKKFNTTVDSIKKKNNLKSNLLSVGQKLII